MTTAVDADTRAYLQLFRNGAVEAGEAAMILSPPPHADSILSLAFANELFSFGVRVVELFKVLDVAPPVAVLVSFVGVRGVRLGLGKRLALSQSLRPIDREVLLLPDVVISDWPFDAERTFKPALDALWQAVGAARCLDYDEQGEWAPRP